MGNPKRQNEQETEEILQTTKLSFQESALLLKSHEYFQTANQGRGISGAWC